jgi:hypothetical protein
MRFVFALRQLPRPIEAPDRLTAGISMRKSVRWINGQKNTGFPLQLTEAGHKLILVITFPFIFLEHY